MQLTFLQADFPLVKTFTLVDGHIEKSPYPNAYLFSSHTSEVDNIKDFAALCSAHAAKGHCLLKGDIKRQLKKESRAGSTDSESATSWICLDIDGFQGFETVQEFLDCIGLGDISHVVQYSASMGVGDSKGLRAHVFMMLSSAVAAPFLKQWLTGLNLSVEELRKEVKLTRTANSLCWPLDITCCQNDKLLYIAPAKLGKGVTDNFKGKRITFVKRKLDVLPSGRIKADINKNRIEQKVLLNDLRKASGLPVLRDNQYKNQNGIAYMTKPGEAMITGIKTDRGFVYMNLNGGDSWAYYHPEDNPEFLYNFKGEPNYRIEELLPEYWKSVGKTVKKHELDGLPSRTYFALRDFRTDTLYNGFYDRDADEVTMAKAANEGRLRSFLKQHGQPVGDFIPDWELVYDPSSKIKFDPDNKRINMYTPAPITRTQKRIVKAIPPTIRKIIESAVGAGVVFDHFINWLAFIVQKKRMTRTSWVLHGNQGTGKGVLFHQIITPLLGIQNVHSMLMDQLDSPFNGWIETSQMVFVDEVQLSKLQKNSLVNANLKSYIVEPTVSVRRMHRELYNARNFANFIFASNQPDPVAIEVTDRRFNVGMFQPLRLVLTKEEFDALAREVEDLYWFCMDYAVDEDKANTVIETDDRKLLISINRTSVDEIADAIIAGNLEYLLDQLPSSSDATLATPQAASYRALMEKFLEHGSEWKAISRDELFIIYNYCVGNVPASPNKFTSMLKHHRLHTKKVRRIDDVFMGIQVEWKHKQAWFEENRAKYCRAPATVTNITKAKTKAA